MAVMKSRGGRIALDRVADRYHDDEHGCGKMAKKQWLVTAMTMTLGLACLGQTPPAASHPDPALVDRIMSAASDQDVESTLNSASAQVSEALFTACHDRAQALLDKTQYPDAIKGFRAALAVAERLHSPDDIAEAWLKIGMGYRFTEQYTVALENYDKALAAAEEAGRKPQVAQILRARGVAFRSLGRTSEAIAADERSIAMYRELNDPFNVARGLNNLALTYWNLGDLRRAAALMEESIQVGRPWPAHVQFVLPNLGAIASLQGNPAAARGYLEQAIAGIERRNRPQELIAPLANLGEVDANSGRLDEALAEYARALALTRELHAREPESIILLNRSAVYVRQHRLDPALADLRQGLANLNGSENSRVSGLLLVSLADLTIQRGAPAEAQPEIERALAIGGRLQSHEVLWQANLIAGECSLALKDTAQARRYFGESIREVELLRDLAGGDEQSMASFLSGDKIKPFHEMLGLQVAAKESAPALATAERARARQLLDTVRFGKTEPQTAMTPEERAEEQRLSRDLARMDRRLAAAEPAQLPAARAEWQTAQVRLETFREQLYATHPGLASQRGDAQPVTLAECSDLLPDDRTALLEFSVAEDAVHVFVIARGPGGKPAMTMRTEPLVRENLPREENASRDLLASRSFQYRLPAVSLYRKLLGPVAAQLRGKDTLVIVPDGPLWDLPFQALIDSSGAHLVERHTVFYAPSLTWLRDRRRLPPPVRPAKLLLALGNPGSANLASSEHEVQGLAAIYGAHNVSALTGDEATRQAWMELAPQYRILHVATHGVLNPISPVYSWLSLAPAKPGGPNDALEAREVIGMKLGADMAVLSACDTARGEVAAGEGLIGMSWAFLIAGASSTVVSQWAVDGASTTELMLEFYRHLKPALYAGVGRARALRTAALSVMKTPAHQHPYYWAGFVEVGDGY